MRRVLVFLLVAGALASLAHPATRALHVDAVRLLARQEGPATRVVGQPPWCTLMLGGYHTELTRAFEERCLADAARSPEALAFACGELPTPPADIPRDHPTAAWAPLALASDIARWHGHRTASSRDPEQAARVRALEERALELVSAAQQLDPRNGAQWIAEAALRFGRDEVPAALDALEEATARPARDDHAVGAYAYLARLLEGTGLRRRDALAEASTTFLRRGALTGAVQRALGHQLDVAIESDDDAQLRRIVELWDALAHASPAGARERGFDRFPILSTESKAKLASSAERIELRRPDRARSLTTEEYREVLREHLASRLPPALTERAVLGQPREATTWWSQRRRGEDALLRAAAIAGLFADGAVRLLALLLAGTALELAMRRERLRPAWVAAAAALMLALLLSADRAYADSVGFQVLREPRPWLTSFQRDVLGALVVVALWVVGRAALERRARFRAWHGRALAALLAIYLGTIAGVALVQTRTTEGVPALDGLTLAEADRAADVGR